MSSIRKYMFSDMEEHVGGTNSHISDRRPFAKVRIYSLDVEL